ncbi:hypothetical protein ACO0QE_000038 [Hanseniaspora vineae]
MSSRSSSQILGENFSAHTKSKKKTLHETTSKCFSKTPKGLIFSKDIKDVYCLMLICLDLTKKSKKRLNNPFHNLTGSSSGSFTFSLQDAVNTMEKLRVDVEMKSTAVSISYSIKAEMSIQLMRIFMKAKLLHTPADRTRTEPKDKILLQPSPKGVCILQKYVKDMGIKNVPAVIYSTLNSNQLFKFERSSITDRIIYNEYFINLLFIRMMGSKPNVWAPTNENDVLPSLGQLLEYNDETFSFDCLDFSQGITNALMQQNEATQNNVNDKFLVNNVSEETLHNEKRVSPLAHRFFTHPDSDSHVQYYTSDCGLRLLQDKSFGKGSPKSIPYSFTSKGIVQWIMDCTDVIYPKEAVTIAALMLKNGLIVPITGFPSTCVTSKFGIGKTHYYTMTTIGCEILSWDAKLKEQMAFSMYGSRMRDDSSIDSSNRSVDCEPTNDQSNVFKNASGGNLKVATLAATLSDPGVRFLFRAHLEREMCVENLDAYVDINKLLKKMALLQSLVESRMKSKLKNKRLQMQGGQNKGETKASAINVTTTINNALIKEAEDCLSSVYQLFSTYITTGAPRQLNIDYVLREKIFAVVLHPDSPIAQSRSKELMTHNLAGSTTKRPSAKMEIVVKAFTDEELSKMNNDKMLIHQTSALKRAEKPKSLPLTNSTTLLPDYDASVSTHDLFQDENPMTPTDEIINHTVETLKLLFPLFEEVNEKLFKMMDSAAFPKFLESNSLSLI